MCFTLLLFHYFNVIHTIVHAEKYIYYSVERRTNEERDGKAGSGTTEGGRKTVA